MPDYEEKVLELAQNIDLVKFGLQSIDLEFAKEAHAKMTQDLSNYHAAAVLNINYNPEEADARESAIESLGLIIKLVENMEKTRELSKTARKAKQQRDDISKLFSW